MFKALYTFNSSDPGTLNANPDDLVCAMAVDSSNQWMQVADDTGGVGYLPKNYLQFCNWANRDFAVQFIDDGIARAHELASVVGKYTSTQLEKLRLLTVHRTYLFEHYEQFVVQIRGNQDMKSRGVPLQSQPPNASTTVPVSCHSEQVASTGKQLANDGKQHANTSGQFANCATPSHSSSIKHSLPASITDTQPNATKEINAPVKLVKQPSSEGKGDGILDHSSSSSQNGPSADVMAAQLTELLRDNTGLSHEKSKIGVISLLEYLMNHNISSSQLPDIHTAVEQGGAPPIAGSELSHDVLEMNSIFNTIAECKDDSQQRSWHLHEDESFISSKLSRLLEIVTYGNREVLVEHISHDLDQIHNIVLYYQMETRSTLRAIMLQIFAAFCTMTPLFITNLLCSVLTLELVRDFMSTTEEQRLIYSAIVLSMLFSTGEMIPVQHNSLLSSSFVDFLLAKIEENVDERVGKVCLELLLSFNQHYTEPSGNMVLQQLSSRQEATILTQNFLKLFNEGEDPVRVIPNDDQMSSVLKFAIDLYSLESTSQLIYTNDAKVLIDIIIRQLTDLSDEDKVRTDYLSLMQLILVNSNYHEHCHRRDDLLIALNQIEFNEEATTNQSEMDVRIAQEIRKVL